MTQHCQQAVSKLTPKLRKLFNRLSTIPSTVKTLSLGFSREKLWSKEIYLQVSHLRVCLDLHQSLQLPRPSTFRESYLQVRLKCFLVGVGKHRVVTRKLCQERIIIKKCFWKSSNGNELIDWQLIYKSKLINFLEMSSLQHLLNGRLTSGDNVIDRQVLSSCS